MTAVLSLYRALGRGLTPVAKLYLARRAAAGKESTSRLAERFGFAALPRPPGRLLWVHAASVGEALSALPLLHRIAARYPQAQMLLTTGTVTSAQVVEGKMPPRCVHQFAALDLTDAVRRFLDHWRPDLAIWVESELWPGFLSELAARNIPAVLVQGRVSTRSFRRWRRWPGIAARLLQTFELCLAQSAADGERLRALGARTVEYLGNLKMAAPPLAADAGELAKLSAALGARPRWLAASTHPGEEEIAARLHQSLAGRHADLLTVLAPRHPQRGAELAEGFRRQGFKVGLRSLGAMPEPGVDLYIADRIDELGLWYRLCDVVLIGGSLVAHGGQNPLEAARLGCAILHGPHTGNFAEIMADLQAAQAARAVADEGELAGALELLMFKDPAQRLRLIEAAKRFSADGDQVLDRISARLQPILNRLEKAA